MYFFYLYITTDFYFLKCIIFVDRKQFCRFCHACPTYRIEIKLHLFDFYCFLGIKIDFLGTKTYFYENLIVKLFTEDKEGYMRAQISKVCYCQFGLTSPS